MQSAAEGAISRIQSARSDDILLTNNITSQKLMAAHHISSCHPYASGNNWTWNMPDDF